MLTKTLSLKVVSLFWKLIKVLAYKSLCFLTSSQFCCKTLSSWIWTNRDLLLDVKSLTYWLNDCFSLLHWVTWLVELFKTVILLFRLEFSDWRVDTLLSAFSKFNCRPLTYAWDWLSWFLTLSLSPLQLCNCTVNWEISVFWVFKFPLQAWACSWLVWACLCNNWIYDCNELMFWLFLWQAANWASAWLFSAVKA